LPLQSRSSVSFALLFVRIQNDRDLSRSAACFSDARPRGDP